MSFFEWKTVAYGGRRIMGVKITDFEEKQNGKCKFYNIQCNKREKDECEFEKFLWEFSCHLCDVDGKEYNFLCCPDKFDMYNTNKQVDLIIVDKDRNIVAIEAKGISFEHLEETHKLIEIVGQKLKEQFSKNASMIDYFTKYGIVIEFNESIIKFAKVINNGELSLDFCRKVSNEILNLENNKGKTIKLCLNIQNKIVHSNEQSEVINKFKQKSKKKKEQIKSLTNDYDKDYKHRKLCTENMQTYLQKNRYELKAEDNYNLIDYYEFMSSKKMEIIFEIKRTEIREININMRVCNTTQLETTIKQKFEKHFIETNQKSKELKNIDCKIRTILFLNRSLETDSSWFDKEVIYEWIKKFASNYEYIDEVWTEEYKHELIEEAFDIIEGVVYDEKEFVKLYP